MVVVARRDPVEAMRVAAGITVFGHGVTLVLTEAPLEVNDAVEEMAELIELAEVAIYSLGKDPNVPTIERDELQDLLASTECCINV